MTYNTNDGSCCGGWGGFGADALILLLFFGLMGGGMWGGFGGFGGGYGGFAQSTTTAAETSALISQQNTADRVAAIAADTRQVLGQTGGIIEAVNTVGNRAQDGFARLDVNLSQLGNNIAMQAVNNHNNLTSQLTEMRFDSAKCCCETQQKIGALECSLTNQIQAAKSEILGAMQAQRMAELEAKNLELKGALSQQNQNAVIAGIVNSALASQRGCSPCCQPSPCDQLSAAIIAKGIDGIVNPTATT